MNIESKLYKRTKQASLLKTLKEGKSFILFGPRQTGKSTLLEAIFAALSPAPALKYYFQLPVERERIEDNPQVILNEVAALRAAKPVYVFIDEIQKIPKVMDVLQFLLDKKMIILGATGSSARKMKSLGTNWLPGRVQLEYLFPLTWEESGLLSAPEKINQFLLCGALPGVLRKPEIKTREQYLANYSSLYLEEEIRQESLTRNVPRFNKFLRLSALESGTAPNFSKIGGVVGLTHPTVREYFQILEDTLIVHRLDAFGAKRDAVLRSSRYFFFDTGVRNTAANLGCSNGILVLQKGLLLEHFIILEIMANFKHQAGVQLSYWRNKKGQEVDLVIQKNKLTALEVKATAKPSAEDLSGLYEFCRKYSCRQAYLVCQVPRAQKQGNIEIIPWFELHKYLKD